MKEVLREKFIAIRAYIINEERSHINNLNFQLKKLEEEMRAVGSHSDSGTLTEQHEGCWGTED